MALTVAAPQAVDEAGNESGQEEFVWSVDLTPPKTVIKQAPKRFTKSKVAVFAVGWVWIAHAGGAARPCAPA